MVKYNYYDILGVPVDAENEQIEKAFTILANKYKSNEVRINIILDAYTTLIDKNKRIEYDKENEIQSKNKSFFNPFKKKQKNSDKEKFKESGDKKFVELLEFDWDSIENEEAQVNNKSFWDELLFKILVISSVTILIALFIYFINNSK